MTDPIVELIAHDHWNIATGTNPLGRHFIRYRTPILSASQCGQHDQLLQIFWRFEEWSLNELSVGQQDEILGRFEDRLCEQFEDDALAVLTAVFTLDADDQVDSYREWIFYTTDARACAERIGSMPHDDDRPYPITIRSMRDPGFSYLHSEILAGLDEDE